MSRVCHDSDCGGYILECPCSDPPGKFCSHTIVWHLLEPSDKPHVPRPVQIINAEKNITLTHEKLHQIFNELQLLKSEVLRRSKEAIEIVQKRTKQALVFITESQEICSRLIEELSETTTVKVEKESSEILSLVGSKPEDLKAAIASWTSPKFNLNISMLLHNAKESFALEVPFKVLEGPQPQYGHIELPFEEYSELYQSSSIFFVEGYNVKDITEINLAKKTKRVHSINIQNRTAYYSTSCTLPDGRIFFYGGHGPFNTGFIWNLGSMEVEEVQNHPQSHACAAYYKESVYMFGGNSGPTQAFRYKLSGEWQSITALPSNANSSNSCVVFEDKIYITSYSLPCIFIFDPETLTYNRINGFVANQYKLICRSQTKLFLMQAGDGIYEINTRANNIKTKHFTEVNLGNIYGFPKQHGDQVYFVLDNSQLYSFDLKTKSITQVQVTEEELEVND